MRPAYCETVPRCQRLVSNGVTGTDDRIDLRLRPKAAESDHRIRAVVAFRFQPALGGPWPGQRGPIGLRVIAV
jgi:hypothetical protein